MIDYTMIDIIIYMMANTSFENNFAKTKAFPKKKNKNLISPNQSERERKKKKTGNMFIHVMNTPKIELM